MVSKKYCLVSSSLNIGTEAIVRFLSKEEFEIERTNFHIIHKSLSFIRERYNERMELMSISIGDKVSQTSQEVFDNVFRQIIFDSFPNKDKTNNLIIDSGTSLLSLRPEKFISDIKIIIIYTHPILLSLRIWNHMTDLFLKTHDKKYLDSISNDGSLDLHNFCKNYFKSWLESFERVCLSYTSNKNVLFIQESELCHTYTSNKLIKFLGIKKPNVKNFSLDSNNNFTKEQKSVKKISPDILKEIDISLKKRIPLSFNEIY